ncbi:hypothetical protein K1719_023883 [Acacia pycnantha]|nr:hypothetical protein K1719_023883 [Acacia pycnantha]
MATPETLHILSARRSPFSTSSDSFTFSQRGVLRSRVFVKATILEKRNMDAKLTKLNNLVIENTKMEYVEANNNQDLHALENELKVRKDELLAAEESIARLTNEKLILARKLSELKKRNADEINLLERRFEQERKDLKSQVNDLEEKLEGFRQELAVAESTLVAKDVELVALQNNLWELENLRDMTEDDTHEKEAKLRESEGSQWSSQLH